MLVIAVETPPCGYTVKTILEPPLILRIGNESIFIWSGVLVGEMIIENFTSLAGRKRQAKNRKS